MAITWPMHAIAKFQLDGGSRKGRWTNPRSGTYPRGRTARSSANSGGRTARPRWSHCSEQCEVRDFAVRRAVLRTAKILASQCENIGLALRKVWGRTARPPGRTARSSAKSSVALRRVDASQCEKFCSHCEILASHCQDFRSASQIFRSAKRFASQCEPTGFALQRVWGRTAKGPGSQCEEKISQCEPAGFAVRTDKPRSAKSLGSQCEEPGVAVRGPRVALREGRDRTAKSSAKKKVRSAGSVGRCHCVGWSTGPSYYWVLCSKRRGRAHK